MISKFSLASVAVVVVAAAVAIGSVWRDAPIVDEIPHIGAGYGYIFEQSHAFNPEHPPLAKDLAALGLYFGGIKTTISHQLFVKHSASVNDQWNFGRQLIFNSDNDPISLIHWAKLPILLLFVLSAWIIFVWSRRLYSRREAFLAVFMFALCPTVIAHSRFVTTDMAALFGVLVGTYFFIQYLQASTRPNLWLAGLALGIALICKFSTFLLLPFFLLLTIAWSYAHRQTIRQAVAKLGKTVLIFIIAFVVVVGPVYQLHVSNYPPAKQKADAASLLATFSNKFIAGLLINSSDKPVLRPFAEYGLGLLMVTQRIEGGNRISFLGQVVNQGGPWYFPIVYAFKEPLPFLILLLIAILTSLGSLVRGHLGRFRHWLTTHFSQFSMLLWLAIYWAFSLASTVNIGVRHLLPVYGFTFILVAGQIGQLQIYRKKYFRVFIGILLTWYVIEFASVYPYYLTYFNQLAGGPAGGHRYVTDSNLDWGQDLQRLADWVKKNNIQKINLDYFGWADQSYYLGNSFKWMVGGQYLSRAAFLRDNPQGGYLAVSATYYQQSIYSTDHYKWLKDIPPVKVIGNSIFVWHITP